MTDPFCKMWIRENKTPLPPWTAVGATETIMDSLNPDFTTPIVMNYYFERKQHLKFEIYDQDGKNQEEGAQGVCKLETTMATILAAPD